MSTAWAHLPNARHIDGIIADVQARPERWSDLLDLTWFMAGTAAQWQVTHESVGAVWDVVRTAAMPMLAALPWTSARGTVLALLAWPDSARMLSMTPAALRTLIDITEGDVTHQAVLILPAVLAGYKVTTGD